MKNFTVNLFMDAVKRIDATFVVSNFVRVSTSPHFQRRPPIFSITGLWSPGVNLTAFE
jgi:hypothetical protein